MFVHSLVKADLNHAASLLDPNCDEHVASEDVAESRSSYVCMDGTAVDINIPVRIFDRVWPSRRQTHIEEHIAMQFISSKSEDCKKLRKTLKEVLPKGVHFVRTKQFGEKITSEDGSASNIIFKDSVVFVFRICQESAVDQLMRIYRDNTLKANLKKIITLQWRAIDLKNMDLELLFEENDYKNIRQILCQGAGESTNLVLEPATGAMVIRCAITVSGFVGNVAVRILDEFKGGIPHLLAVLQNVMCPRDSDSDSDSDIIVDNIYLGSINILLRVKTIEALEKLWKRYKNGNLRNALERILITEEIRKLGKTEMAVTMSEEQYQDVRSFLHKLTQHKEKGNPVGEDEPMKELEDKFDKIKIREVYLDGCYHKEIKLRDYQKELAAPALAGNNTVICAPTNSGKTFVAMEIAKKHLEEHGDTASEGYRKAKVIFVVNKQNLVLQQRSRFEDYLSTYKTSDLSGNNTSSISLKELLTHCDVVVLTAQILVNALDDKSVKITDISLLIFDECHHTQNKEPYNKIMMNYIEMKSRGETNLPQVIGMTASLDVGKARNVIEAQNHILYLCSNLDTACISTVKEHKEELKEHTSTPVRTVHTVHRNRGEDIFDSIINQVMENIEKFVGNATGNQFELPPTGRESQQYRQWCETLYEHGMLSGNRYVVKCTDQLREYNIALSINDATRMKDAVAKLRKYFSRLNEKKFTDVDRKLKDLYLKASDAIDEGVNQHGEPLNPKLLKIQEILLERNEGSNGAKGILFSKTRETTLALEGWIKETDVLKDIIKPLRLVGSNDSDGAMTQNDQEEVISKFKHGRECNLIIATTVAEEDLDIADCSYVIRYDMIGNEISSVQSRGRIRTKEGGQYSSVIGADSNGLQKEQLNQYREILMIEALAHVQEMDENAYTSKIQEFQDEAAKERTLKERLRKCLKSKYDPNDVTFKCRKCQVVACQANDLRQVKSSYHVVIPDDFYDKIEKIDIHPSKVQTFYDVSMPQSIQCKKCGEHWGCIVNFRGLEMPCLKVNCFVLELKKGSRVLKMNPKQWKKCPFDVPQVEISELLDLKMTI